MRFEIRHRPSYSILLVELGAGETITAEAGALTFMSPNVEADTRTRQ
ncbi:MAG TPA: TIGR00266 family protein, partial [Candidatus Bathyarchaeota archaeon]|nr:TIGR00266 family protein [Candidatus Bathyarchaeota archaeon]